MKKKCDRCKRLNEKLYLIPYLSHRDLMSNIEICQICSIVFHERVEKMARDFIEDYKTYVLKDLPMPTNLRSTEYPE
jgi:hypothetical protein